MTKKGVYTNGKNQHQSKQKTHHRHRPGQHERRFEAKKPNRA